jgi:hypothetical protein
LLECPRAIVAFNVIGLTFTDVKPIGRGMKNGLPRKRNAGDAKRTDSTAIRKSHGAPCALEGLEPENSIDRADVRSLAGVQTDE